MLSAECFLKPARKSNTSVICRSLTSPPRKLAVDPFSKKGAPFLAPFARSGKPLKPTAWMFTDE